MGRLNGKVAMITGAAGGIGRAAARLFAAEGAQLLLIDLDGATLADLADELGHERVEAVTANVTDAEAIEAAVALALDRFGHLDIGLLNAGIEGKPGKITEMQDEEFDRVMAVNVRSVWLGLKYLMAAMEKSGGSIVITSSTSGLRAVRGMAPYTCSKHAVIGLMKAAAMEGAANKIRVNTVNPAPIDTAMITRLEEALYPDGNGRQMAAGVPLARYGEPEEVARMMLFLASDESSYCTGSVYMVDGGVTAGRA